MVTIRPGRADDASALARLRWEWRADEGRDLVMGEAQFQAAFESWVVDHLQTHRPFVAESDGRVVGMGWLAIIDRVPGPDGWERRSAAVQSVYVTPTHRGAGVGAAVVQALIDESHRTGCGYLTLHPTQRSFPMYRRLGFREWDGVLELDIGAVDRMPPP